MGPMMRPFFAVLVLVSACQSEPPTVVVVTPAPVVVAATSTPKAPVDALPPPSVERVRRETRELVDGFDACVLAHASACRSLGGRECQAVGLSECGPIYGMTSVPGR